MPRTRIPYAVFSVACGLYFALLQFSYFFTMEAFLSSQFLSYFLTLFFWLCGFLVGLNIVKGSASPTSRRFLQLLVLGVATYYLTWALTRVVPFHSLLYPVAALCSAASGTLAGYFFPYMACQFKPIHRLLFHENNGFILGLLVSLEASIHCGSWFLTYAPAIAAAAVAGALCRLRTCQSMVE